MIPQVLVIKSYFYIYVNFVPVMCFYDSR